MKNHARTVNVDQLGVDVAANGGSAGQEVTHARVCHCGYHIIVGEEATGWWARIDELNVETMLFANRAAAFAAALAFIDRMAARPALSGHNQYHPSERGNPPRDGGVDAGRDVSS